MKKMFVLLLAAIMLLTMCPAVMAIEQVATGDDVAEKITPVEVLLYNGVPKDDKELKLDYEKGNQCPRLSVFKVAEVFGIKIDNDNAWNTDVIGSEKLTILLNDKQYVFTNGSTERLGGQLEVESKMVQSTPKDQNEAIVPVDMLVDYNAVCEMFGLVFSPNSDGETFYFLKDKKQIAIDKSGAKIYENPDPLTEKVEEGGTVRYDTVYGENIGRTMVPFRAIIEGLKGTVDWDDGKKIASAEINVKYFDDAVRVVKEFEITPEIDFINKKYYLNNAGVELGTDEFPYINENGKSMVPLRIISECLGKKVLWYGGEKQFVTIIPANFAVDENYYEGFLGLNGVRYGSLDENKNPNGFGIVMFEVDKNKSTGKATPYCLVSNGFSKDNKLNENSEVSIAWENKEFKLEGHDTFIRYEGIVTNTDADAYHYITEMHKGNQYKGWKFEDKFNGYGVYTWSDGRVYEGSFEEGRPSGWGKFTWSADEEYIGEWQNSKRTGYGIYINKTTNPETNLNGEWFEDKFLGN